MKWRLPETAEWTVADFMAANPGLTSTNARWWMSRLCRAGETRAVVRGNIHHVARYTRDVRPKASAVVLRTPAASSVFNLGQL